MYADDMEIETGAVNFISGQGSDGLTGVVNLDRLTVAQLLEGWPAAIPAFLGHHMNCVGCSMARFENLADAARIYGLDVDAFFLEIRRLT